MTSAPPQPDEPPGRGKGSRPLILSIVAAAVIGPIVLLGWLFFVTWREPWDDMERVLADLTIPDGFHLEDEERRGKQLFGGGGPGITRYYETPVTMVVPDELCAAGRLNDAENITPGRDTCRGTLTAEASLVERVLYLNSGYTVVITTSRDSLRGPLILRITITN